ncbi:MAG: hypothetical protein HQK54_10960 [Oligoflexales bacterium]|nr:hypothetical protein [Oligoflexales bacterium]
MNNNFASNISVLTVSEHSHINGLTAEWKEYIDKKNKDSKIEALAEWFRDFPQNYKTFKDNFSLTYLGDLIIKAFRGLLEQLRTVEFKKYLSFGYWTGVKTKINDTIKNTNVILESKTIESFGIQEEYKDYLNEMPSKKKRGLIALGILLITLLIISTLATFAPKKGKTITTPSQINTTVTNNVATESESGEKRIKSKVLRKEATQENKAGNTAAVTQQKPKKATEEKPVAKSKIKNGTKVKKNTRNHASSANK